MQKNAPIGVLDSGVGGLSVLKCLQAALPQEDFIYVGDTARTPYGPRSEAEVRRFVGEIIDYLDGRGVKLVVIACNTLTVLGVDTLKGSHAFEIVGMSKGAQLVLAASSRKKIGVFATEFTINSGAHKAAILAADDGADVYPQACPKFVPLIEGEQFDSAEVRAAVAEYAAPLKAAGIDTASGVPNKNKVGSITLAQAEEIAKTKMPDLNAASLEAACSMVRGTCRSMGVTVEG